MRRSKSAAAPNPKSEEKSLLQIRIQERLDALGLTARKASEQAKLGKDFVREILNGSSQAPRKSNLEKLAQVLDCSVTFLTSGLENIPVNEMPTAPVSRIPIVGTVSAGVFTEMSGPEPWLSEYEFAYVDGPRNSDYPDARCFAFRVSGDSMNDARKRVEDGDIVLCVDAIDAQLRVLDQKMYVVRRTRDAGQTYEWTVKRARVFPDRIELRPESTNPIHKPFIIPRMGRSPFDADVSDTGEEIIVVGLVYSVISFNP